MARGDRRRRRRLGEAGAPDQPELAAGEETTAPQDLEQDQPHFAGEEVAPAQDLRQGLPHFAGEEGTPTDEAAFDAPEDAEPEWAGRGTADAAPHPDSDPSENSGGEAPRAPDFTPAVARPAAMAQVLSAPPAGAFAEPAAAAHEPDPFFRPPTQDAEWHEPEADLAAAAVRPEAPSQPPRPASPPPAREGSWTREPVLLALLLAALLVLAFDSYLMLRLNGLSDRLSALAARPAVAAVAPNAAAMDRPWVGLDTIRTAPFASGGRPVTTVHFGNSGAEPAYDFRSNTVGSLRSAPTPAPEIPPQAGLVASSGVLLPNAGGTLTFFANTRPLTPQEAANIRSGQDVLWLAGRLDYKDGGGRSHETTFRYRYNPALNGFTAAPEGNTAN